MTDTAFPHPSGDGDTEGTEPERAPRDPLIRDITDALLAKKALDIIVMDLRAVTDVADYFVLCTGSSDLHVRSLAEDVVERLKEAGHRPWHVEGMAQRRWVLVDVVEVVVYIFGRDAREHYALERLWGDAELFTVDDGGERPVVAEFSSEGEPAP